MTAIITTAVVLRGIFVAAGAATLQEFHQVLLLFSAILAYSSFKVLFGGDDDEEEVRKYYLLFLTTFSDTFSLDSIAVSGYIRE